MQTKKQSSGIVAGILLPMGLVCLFAFCSLALALLGGQAYKNIQANVDDGYGANVAAAYLRTKLGQNSGDILLRDEAGTQVLVLQATYGTTVYETRIYMQDGRLMESFDTADTPFSAANGTTIAQLQACSFTLQNGLFTAEITSLGGTHSRTAYAVGEGASQ